MSVDYLQNKPSRRPLKVLFDSGSSRTVFKRVSYQQVLLHTPCLEQRNNTLEVMKFKSQRVLCSSIYVFQNEAQLEVILLKLKHFSVHTQQYDVILGQDVMVAARLTLCCDTQSIRWGDLSMSWKTADFLKTDGLLQHLSDEVTHANVHVTESFATQLSVKEIL